MNEGLRSVLVATVPLDAIAVVALGLTIARGGVWESRAELRGAVRAAVAAVLLQGAHFGEELATGFARRLPELLGLAPWPPAFFPVFNLAWLAVWALAVGGLAGRRRMALFPLWFLALAGLVNALAHPLLALRAGGYFPGLGTAPLVGAAGLVLVRRLSRVTAGRRGAKAPSRLVE